MLVWLIVPFYDFCALFDPSPLTVCINCSFHIYMFAVLLPDSSRLSYHSAQQTFLKMNTRHQAHKPVKSATNGADFRFSKRKRVRLRQRAKFGRNRSNRGRDNGDFSIFPRWRPSAILDLLCVCWDHPRWSFGGVYRCAKFGWNRCSSFNNVHVFGFREFGLKTPIHAPQNEGFGRILPLHAEQCQQNPKKNIPARGRVV